MVQFKQLEDDIFDPLQSFLSRMSNCCGEVHVGIDVMSISRMEKALEVSGFDQQYFTPNEINYCESKNYPAQHYAARWAAKESVIKAHPETENRIKFKDVEVLLENNSPFLEMRFENQVKESAISLTHDESVDAALSFVLFIIES